ncbi:MAG: phosphoribosylglycinamide formyltransferase [Flammeovirgaceae bacterium]|nr:phosphoribosylglycinamide formyltransferase [Flammeovirgaceae bacterium]
MNKFKIAILASGSGTNAEKIMSFFRNHDQIEVSLLLCNKSSAFVLERAKKFNVPTRIFSRQQFEGGEVSRWLQESNITHIVLAGFLWLIPESLINQFSDHIINIHPALLPKYGGKGMYGMKVHEAVKASGDKESGITIHQVNAEYDKGMVLFQAKCIVFPGDTPEQIAQKIHELEYKHYPSIIEDWILNGR